MGILRTDRVSGLGGANAIKGSVFFGGDGTSGNTKGTSLNIVDANDKADLNFAGNDFTFEAWVFPPAGVEWNTVYCQSWGLQIYINTGDSNGSYVRVYVSNQDGSGYAISGATSAYNSIIPDQWNHVAFSRSGNSWTIFTNGTAATSSTSSQSLVSSNADYTIGIFNSIGATSDAGSYFGFNGFISNLRIRTGAHYLPSTNFTPPVGELQKTSDTVLLACQSPGDITKEATGKTLVPTRKNLNDALPQASHFTPNSPVGFSTTTDVGTQFGSTFDGVTTFDSQAYFVPPGGNTRERNRGRGVISGGRNRSTMEFINIQSQGNSQEFGDSVTGDGIEGFAVGSSTRGLFSGPQSPLSNVIEFITFASQSNGTDFGDTTSARRSGAGAGNETRGLFAGGIVQASSPYGGTNLTDFVTIATAGNATDFGDLNTANEQAAPNADTTRVVISGGTVVPSITNVIDFFTIATTGNATDFGDMTTTHGAGAGGASSSTRGLIAGGTSPDKNNFIQFITIQTTGNSTDFGDLTSAKGYPSGMSNSTRGVFAGGYQPTQINAIDFVNIATTGDANDFGDLSLGANFVTQATSDCHGGLS